MSHCGAILCLKRADELSAAIEVTRAYLASLPAPPLPPPPAPLANTLPPPPPLVEASLPPPPPVAVETKPLSLTAQMAQTSKKAQQAIALAMNATRPSPLQPFQVYVCVVSGQVWLSLILIAFSFHFFLRSFGRCRAPKRDRRFIAKNRRVRRTLTLRRPWTLGYLFSPTLLNLSVQLPRCFIPLYIHFHVLFLRLQCWLRLSWSVRDPRSGLFLYPTRADAEQAYALGACHVCLSTPYPM